MSWTAILVLGGGCYLLKVAGLVLLGGRELPPTVNRCVALLPAALLPALIAVQTLTTDDRWVLDARVAGVGVAIVAAWRKVPFPLVIVLGAAVAAAVRALA